MASAALKEYTRADVARHRAENDCWIIFRGQVLEVPVDFAATHPGGPVYLDVAGADGTIMFEDNGHPDSAREMMKLWVIGVLKAEPAAATGAA